MPVCSFCKENYDFPRGTTVVQKDGNIKFYCSSKCKKNLEMGRDNKKVKWVSKSATSKEEKKKKEEIRASVLEEKKKEQEEKKKKEAERRAAKKERKRNKKGK